MADQLIIFLVHQYSINIVAFWFIMPYTPVGMYVPSFLRNEIYAFSWYEQSCGRYVLPKHWHLEMHSEYCAHPFTLFDVLCRMNKCNIRGRGGSVSQDTNLKKDMCLCMRPSTNVLCTVCGYIMVGRIRKSCPQHNMVSVRCKFFFWLESLSERIKLIKWKGLCVDRCLVYLKHCWLTLCPKDGWLFCPNGCYHVPEIFWSFFGQRMHSICWYTPEKI